MRTVLRAISAGGVAAVLASGCTSSSKADSTPIQPTVAPTSGATATAESVQALVSTTVQASGVGKPFDRARKLQAPPGWTVSVWAKVPGARLLAWTPDKRLLVSRPKSGDVLALTPGSGRPATATLVSGLDQPHGLVFKGNTLYVAESDQIDRYTYAAGKATGRQVVVPGLPDAKSPELGGAYAHALKSVAIGRDGSLYFSIGSTGNVSPQDRDASPQRAAILRVPPGGGKATVFARGVRNGTGLAVDPNGGVWTAVNNRDNLAYPYAQDYDGDGKKDRGEVMQAYVNDHPIEPLARLTPGRDLGWPFCNPDPDLKPGVKGSPLSYTSRPFVRDQQYNADGSKLDCTKLPPIEQAMGAHSAPLGLSFTGSPGLPGGYGPGALVGIHGSWNRKPPRAPEVSFFAWRNGTLGPQQTILSGFQLPDGSRWGRPVMAVQGPDQALYVSDDLAGVIYRVTAK